MPTQSNPNRHLVRKNPTHARDKQTDANTRTGFEHGRHRHAAVPSVDPHQAVHHHIFCHECVALRETETAEQGVLAGESERANEDGERGETMVEYQEYVWAHTMEVE